MASFASNQGRMTSLKQTMKTIFNSKDRADVVFIVHGRDLPAHQIIVANRSPVLKAMIEGPMAPPDQRHLIEDPEITYEDFENFLSFLYTDNCNFQPSKVKALLHLGNFYDIPLLLERCVEKMDVTSRGSDSLWENAEMGLRYAPNSSLVQKCFRYLGNCLRRDVSLSYQTENDELKWISAGLAMEFVKEFPRDADFTEDDVFKKILEWSNNECVRQTQEITTENVRAIMLPFMEYFDTSKFLALTVATTIKTFKLLPDGQLIDSLADLVVKGLNESENSSRLRRNGGGRYSAYYGRDEIEPNRYYEFRVTPRRTGGRSPSPLYVNGRGGGFGAAAAAGGGGGNRGMNNAGGRGSYYAAIGRGGYGVGFVQRGRIDDHPRGGAYGAGRGRGGGLHHNESFDDLWM